MTPSQEYVRAYNKAYWAANREKMLAHMKAYREKNREALKAYRESNRINHRAVDKAYRNANPQRLKEYREKTRGAGSSKRSWMAMKERCFNVNHSAYRHYGGRGITVCSQWLQYAGFYADMGDRPQGFSLDRINVDGNYEPNNCRWATPKEQANNRRPRSPR